MKKGYYIHLELHKNQAGVRRKIDGQMSVLRRYFDVSEIVVKKEKVSVFQGILSRLPFGSYAMDYDAAFTQIDDPAFVYIRHRALDRRYYYFIKRIREKYPHVKIILEIPTYPYKGELLASKTMWPFYYKDVFRRRHLKKLVDRIVTFTDDDEIFNIPTIKVQNGIDVDAVIPANVSNNQLEINLIAVAALLPGHGYERCICGLADYYRHSSHKEKVIKIHIVGEGQELEFYKKLVDKYALGQYVFFYGKRTGTELDAIYDNKDMGLGCFGDYKVGMYKSSALKTREYLAKGLPVISADWEDAFDDTSDYPYFLQVPNDASPIDMGNVIHFYDQTYNGASHEKVCKEIRRFAKEHVDMAVVMKPIIEYLGGSL